MPYLPRITFKTGINPSNLSRIDMQNLTGTQKLQLTSARIFNENIGGNLRSGNKKIGDILIGKKRLERYYYPLYNMNRIYPFLHQSEEKERRIMMDERRKLRIMMRGVKIGRSKGGGRISLMNVFEKKEETE